MGRVSPIRKFYSGGCKGGRKGWKRVEEEKESVERAFDRMRVGFWLGKGGNSLFKDGKMKGEGRGGAGGLDISCGVVE